MRRWSLGPLPGTADAVASRGLVQPRGASSVAAQITDEMTRPYFSLPSVLEGMFG